jgi:hypothetical protein
VLAGGSVLLADLAPAYDPWAWLLWGREIAHGSLSTAEGPAFKPLTVAVTTLLTPFGGAAPWLWVLIARAGTAAALVLAWRRAGLLGAGAVLLTGELAGLSASGHSEGLLLALALAAWELWERDRRSLAFALGVAAALIRVEAWPFLLVAAWRSGIDRRALAAAAVAVPVLWFVPEYLGSGDLLRSSDRARIPNPGQPALADVPFWASLREALALVPWPLWLGVAWASLRRRETLAPALAGAAWILLVALMCQFGNFSGEPRYALPGACLIALTGAWALQPAHDVGWRAQRLVALAVLAAIALPRLDDLADVRSAQAYQWTLQEDLGDAIDRAGGREAVLACGTPYVGPLRGPLMAYKLHVFKDRVEPDDPPRPPGTVFQSRLAEDAPLEPSAGFGSASREGLWTVRQSC